jgi:hypothetical protein
MLSVSLFSVPPLAVANSTFVVFLGSVWNKKPDAAFVSRQLFDMFPFRKAVLTFKAMIYFKCVFNPLGFQKLCHWFKRCIFQKTP